MEPIDQLVQPAAEKDEQSFNSAKPQPADGSSISRDVAFFEKVKKHIGDEEDNNKFRELFHSFLRDSLSSKELIEKAIAFIGKNQELMKELEEFMRSDYKDSFERKVEGGISKLPQGINFNYTRSTKAGPSYRLLGKSQIEQECSGRDELCREVLNDHWGSHPKWAAKGRGFKGTPKNESDLKLFSLEDEQHTITIGIETNRGVIRVLEQLEQDISAMDPEKKNKFRLTAEFGGDTKSVYQRALKNIYGNEEGLEIIKLLQQYPAIVAPIVLKRLKEKDLEWNEAKVGWQVQWREQGAMAYEKSLDHRGTEIKEADNKLFTIKSLMEQFNNNQKQKTAKNPNKKSTTSVSEPGLEYAFNDFDVILTACRLMTIASEHSGLSSPHDRERIAGFIKAFIPLFFGIGSNKVEKVVNAVRQKSSSCENNSSSHDLLRDVLKRVKNESGVWISRPTKLLRKESPANAPVKRTVNTLYCNSSIFALFRTFQILYSRLLEIKEFKEDPVIEFTGLSKDPEFTQELDKNKISMGTASKADAYSQVLELCEKFLQGEIDSDVFEGSLRKACLMKGYLLYTLDKLLKFSLNFIQGMIVTDGKKTNPHRARSANVLLMYQRDRERSGATERGEEHDLMAYQRRVDALLGMKDAMFRIELDEGTKMVTMCSVTRGKYPFVPDMDAEAEWNSYTESYMMSAPTEGVPIDRCRKVFLHRNLPREKNTPEAGIRKDGRFFEENLKIAICENTYRLTFKGTEDFFVRARTLKAGKGKDNTERTKKTWKRKLDEKLFGDIDGLSDRRKKRKLE
ncbi:Transcriptional regulatory protein sin3 [Rhizina undulata]